MKLYLLRHGEAGEHRTMGDDSLRPLTPDGVARMQKQAQTLHRWGIKVDLLLSSPYVRARQTADAIAAAFNFPVIEELRLKAGCTPSVAAEIVRAHADAKHLWLTGHEPDLSGIVAHATGGTIEMKKGSVACLHVDQIYPLRATLIWLLTADLMLADSET